MSMAALRRRRFVQAAVEEETPPPDGVTVIAAELRNNSGSNGTKLVSAGFLLPVGLVPSYADLDKLSVWIDGVEQLIYVATDPDADGIRGDHVDGSVRSALVQFPFDFTDSGPVPCEVRYGLARGTDDLSATPVTLEVVERDVVIRASHAVDLCKTRLPFQILRPAADDDVALVGMYQTIYEPWFDALQAVTPKRALFGSTYPMARSYAAQYCRTGEDKYRREAIAQAVAFVLDRVVGSGLSVEDAARMNPEDLPDCGYGGVRPEQHNQMQLDFAVLYYLTGWKYGWLTVHLNATTGAAQMYSQARAESPTLGWIDGGNENGGYPQNPRYNLIGAWSFVLGVRMHLTMDLETGAGGGRVMQYPEEIEWFVNNWNTNRHGYLAQSSSWRDNTPGISGLVANGAQFTVTANTVNTFTADIHNDYTNFAIDGAVGYKVYRPLTSTTGTIHTVTANTAGNYLTHDLVTFTVTPDFSPSISNGDVLEFKHPRGRYPFFQSALSGGLLGLLKTEVVTDARIDNMIVDLADAFAANIQPLIFGDIGYSHGATHGYEYIAYEIAQQRIETSGDNIVASFTMPMWATINYMAWRITGDSAYRTRGDYCVQTANIAMLPQTGSDESGKYFGETLGNTMDASAWRDGDFTNEVWPSATIVQPPTYTS